MNIHPAPKSVGPTEFDVLGHVVDVTSALAGRVLEPHVITAIAAAASAALTPTTGDPASEVHA